MNDIVVKQFGSVGALQSYANAMGAAVAAIPAGFDGKDILKLHPDHGYFLFGEAGTEVRENDLWAVNPLSCRHGYIAFTPDFKLAEMADGEVAEIISDVREPLPAYEDLPQLKQYKFRGEKTEREPDWQHQLALDFRCIQGDNDGAEVVYKPVSVGGLRMQRKLFEEMRRRIADGNEYCVPVIELYVSEYNNKNVGNKRTFNPEFEIKEWMSLAEALSLGAGGPTEEVAGEDAEDVAMVTNYEHDHNQVEPEYDENGNLVADENGEVVEDAVADEPAPEPEPEPARQPATRRPATRQTATAAPRGRTGGAAPAAQSGSAPAGRGQAQAAQPQPVAGRRGGGRPAGENVVPLEQSRARTAPRDEAVAAPQTAARAGRAGPRPGARSR